MKKEIVSLCCVLALLGGTTAAFAGAYGEREQPEELPSSAPAVPAVAPAPAETFGASGSYIEIGGVYVIENFDASSNAASMDDDNARTPPLPVTSYRNSGGYQLRAGYRIAPWVAVEGEWEQDLNFRDSVEASVYDLTVNGKFYPFASRVQPYALVGMGWVNGLNDGSSHENENSLGFRFGLGVDVYITKSIGVAAEASYVLPATGYLSDHGFDTIPVSLNLFYRFS